MDANLKTFGEADERTVQQMLNCLSLEEGSIGVLCADNHLGYGQPVGGAVAYRSLISVSGVGYDIGCGNKAARTGLLAEDVHVPSVMDEIARRVSFGIGRNPGETADHPVLEEIADAAFAPQRRLLDKAANQLGTVGAGNHYVDLFEGEDGQLWVGVHFGSRGFGHQTATGFLSIASKGVSGKESDFFEHAPEGEPMQPPVALPTDSWQGEAYVEAMELAGKYAYAGRDVVVDRVLEILGTEANYEVHNHHNFAWRETHFGEEFWVVRKGCTPAFPDQQGFVGATMGEDSVILSGRDSEASREALFSTVHGAGRAMSRTAAAGKRRKRWSCLNRDCDWFQPPHTHKPEDGRCPECGHPKIQKRLIQMSEGRIDWQAELAKMRAKPGRPAIELRGGAPDEAPGAYKRLHEVVEAQGETVAAVHVLRPVGVAMAPEDTVDPWKD